MAYPAIVMCAVIVIVTAMMIFIVPIFKHLFHVVERDPAPPDPDRHRNLQHRGQHLACSR